MRIDEGPMPRQAVDQCGRTDAARLSERARRSAAHDGCRAVRDEVELSPEARALREVRTAAGQVPEVRPELVAELRSQIDAGTYHVDVKILARKMLEHIDG